MKKIISLTLSLTLVLLALASFMTPASAASVDLYTPAKEGDRLFVANFKGVDGEWEPIALSGTPVVTPSESGDSMTIVTTQDKNGSYWGGWIETLPLNENTRYTIYYTVTRTNTDSVGVYCDATYGAYGYAARTKLMERGSSLPGHDYVYYDRVGIEVNVVADGEKVTQEFALEVNGTNNAIAHYIKNKAGEYVKVDDSGYNAIPFFNSDVLGLFFYTYYAAHSSQISNVYVIKGLAYGTYETPAPTSAPETTATPTTATPTTATPTTATPTTAGPETNSPVTKAPATTTAASGNGGCGGAIVGYIAFIPTLVAGALVVRKKRD